MHVAKIPKLNQVAANHQLFITILDHPNPILALLNPLILPLLHKEGLEELDLPEV